MELILLSGGSGKRLWPLSNDARSKQFLKVLANEHGEMESMLQRVWKQLDRAGLQQSTTIAASTAQVDMIQSQIGWPAPLIIEPERRDTFAAIALAAVYLYCIKGVGLQEVIGILPVDPFVEDRFFQRVRDLEGALIASQAELALIGIEPTIPSSKYGYIVPAAENSQQDYLTTGRFKEKPSESEAACLIKEGALWNAGVFAFKLEYILSLLESRGLPIHYEELQKHYSRLPSHSFDYEVVEKAEKIVAIPYSGSWKDLGTWNTLTEEMGAAQIGDGLVSSDSSNTHLVNELGIPVTVIGANDLIIAASPDGILVADKKASPRIKTMMEGIERRPMYEERRWGWYRVLDYTKLGDGTEVLTKRIGIKATKNLSYQTHGCRSEAWTIIKGEGEFALNGCIYSVKAGDILHIPTGAEHGIKAVSELEIIEVQSGTKLVEEDIHRIYTNWNDVVQACNKVVS
ncbi:sugar phosphate nucleotidyltransferase [Bacillus badius]|uniref:sugar phosphate nucleotidyltransferase n=1 Tax=Bacillus badius TaxID=1455 RepID=UPI001CBC7BFA|nr:sugar phosphate nucleotidyltransferase [Bacillus badius]MED0667988.1 sugar phosphate nucleotidyltransferase [Bacillus badius]UAT33016.1 cupin domain-containing protein [Bacillus badius]